MPGKNTEREKSPAKTVKKTATAKKKTAKPAPAKKTAATRKSARPKKTAQTAKAPKAKKTAAATSRPAPAEREEQIRIAAYYRWEQRGRMHGSDVQDWLAAESERAE